MHTLLFEGDGVRGFGTQKSQRVDYDAATEVLVFQIDEIWEMAKSLESVVGIGESAASIAKMCSRMTDQIFEGSDGPTLIQNSRGRMRELINNLYILEGKRLKAAICKVFSISEEPLVQQVDLSPQSSQEEFSY